MFAGLRAGSAREGRQTERLIYETNPYACQCERPRGLNPLLSDLVWCRACRHSGRSDGCGKRAALLLNVLFLCTGNSARSILAESLLNHWGHGKFRAFSAGSFPKGQVHPLALELLASANLHKDGLRSKSWDEFAVPGAPALDFIFTVCDNAAGEVCPIWPGKPMTAHWGIPDPAAVEGTDIEKRFAFGLTPTSTDNDAQH
jgi:arsenate reductase (thioredoxin)